MSGVGGPQVFDFYGVAGWSTESTPKAVKLIGSAGPIVWLSYESAKAHADRLNAGFAEVGNFRAFGLTIEVHEIETANAPAAPDSDPAGGKQ